MEHQLLAKNFQAASQFWQFLGVLKDHEELIERLEAELVKNELSKLTELTTQIRGAYADLEDSRGEDLSVEVLGVFGRKFFNLYFKKLREAADKLQIPGCKEPGLKQRVLQSLFPLYVVCADYDNVKGLNTMCGGNYPRANLILHECNSTLLDAAEKVARESSPRLPGGVPELPTLACQFQSGDEIVLLLPWASSRIDAIAVKDLCEELLSKKHPFKVEQHGGKASRWDPSARFWVCEIPNLDANPNQLVADAFMEIHDEKMERSGTSAQRA